MIDREDGAILRVRQRVMSVLIAEHHGFAERIGRKAIQRTGRITHALKKLGNDGARIAPRAIEQCIGDGGEHCAEVFVVRSAQYRQG